MSLSAQHKFLRRLLVRCFNVQIWTIFSVFCITVEPRFADTRLIQTAYYYGPFSLSLPG